MVFWNKLLEAMIDRISSFWANIWYQQGQAAVGAWLVLESRQGLFTVFHIVTVMN